MKVFRNKTWRHYPITLKDFLLVMKEELAKPNEREYHTYTFDKILTTTAKRTGVAVTDVIRIFELCYLYSKEFNRSLWVYVSFDNRSSRFLILKGFKTLAKLISQRHRMLFGFDFVTFTDDGYDVDKVLQELREVRKEVKK